MPEWVLQSIGYLRTIVTGLALLLQASLAVAAAVMTFVPEAERERIEKRWGKRRKRFVRLLLGLVAGVSGLGFYEEYQESKLLRKQLDEFRLVTETTAQDVLALRQDLRTLGDDLLQRVGHGADRIVAAIEYTHPASGAPMGQASTTTTTTSTTSTTTTTIPMVIARHVRLQRNVTTDRLDFPYALQVFLQTDQTSKPTTLKLYCDGAIGDADFFVTGKTVVMGRKVQILNESTLSLGFVFPSWTPDSPIVVKIYSLEPLRVINLTIEP